MKAGKIVLALALAAGVVFALLNFPDPLSDQVAATEKAAAEKTPGTEPAPPAQ